MRMPAIVIAIAVAAATVSPAANADDNVLVEATGPWVEALGKTMKEARALADELGYKAADECRYVIDNSEVYGDVDFGAGALDCPDDTRVVAINFLGSLLGQSLDPLAEVTRMTSLLGSKPTCARLDSNVAIGCLWDNPPAAPGVGQVNLMEFWASVDGNNGLRLRVESNAE